MRRSKKLAIACGVVAVGIAVAMLPRGQKPSPTHTKAAAPPRPATRKRATREAAPLNVPDEAVELPRLIGSIDNDETAPGREVEDPFNKRHEIITVEPLFDDGELPPATDPWRPSTKAPPLRAEPTARRVTKYREVFDEPLDEPLDGPRADSRASGESTEDATTLIHRVQEGDTLWLLARRYLGSSERYWELFAANRDRLRNPDFLPVGLELRIPQDESAPPTAYPPETERPLAPLSGRANQR